MKQTHFALFWISLDVMAGIEDLKATVSEIGELGEIVSSSSVYKKFLDRKAESLNSELCVSIRIETEKNQEDIFLYLSKKVKCDSAKRRSNERAVLLLAFDQNVRLCPGENLPSPILHTNPLALKCAAEAWGEYEHPVLKRTLNDLARSSAPFTNVEFFAQGRVLF